MLFDSTLQQVCYLSYLRLAKRMGKRPRIGVQWQISHGQDQLHSFVPGVVRAMAEKSIHACQSGGSILKSFTHSGWKRD